jgi:hypothetical protein
MKNMKTEKQPESMAAEPARPEYPYGLKLRLEKEELIKLGFKGLPKVGETFDIEAKGVIQHVSMSAHEEGSYASCELQITDLDLEENGEDKGKKLAAKMFDMTEKPKS